MYTYQLNTHRAFQESYVNKPISLTGTVVALEKIPASRHRWHMLIETSQIHTQEGTAKAKHMIGLYLMRDPNVCVDDTIFVKNITIKKIENSSYNMFLAKEKISATAFLDNPDINCIARPTYSINRYLSFLRNNIFSAVQRSMNKETFALYSSIFLGNKTSVKQEMDYAKEPFKIWGISHYLARSGLHLLIFGMVWHFILGFAPILFFWKQLFLLLLIGSYAVLSWSSVSFNRALIMFLIAKFCLLHKIRLHYVHLICLATSIVLMFNPLQLFYLDFQLSFGLTFALAWFTHIETHKKAA